MIEGFDTGTQRGARSVTELVREIGDLLSTRLGAYAVRGEISGFARAASGHCYFNLKDSDGGNALLRCAMFRRAASLLSFAPAEGQLVELRGRVTLYEPRGELQFVVEAMQGAGAGALYEQYLQTKARLEAQGLFDSARKRRVPVHPCAIGVVTSLGAAALHDVLSALQRRVPHVHVVVYPCIVQGVDAPAAIVTAIAAASRRAEVDTLIVCRGGGSIEDLWAFNDERVVRAIVGAGVPVVCGVGHETDVTLADFAADLRAPTPTAAAELAAPTRQASMNLLEDIARGMRQWVRRAIDTHSQRLDRIGFRLSRPSQSVRQQAQRMLVLMHRLRSCIAQAAQAHRTRHEQLESRLRHCVALRLAGGEHCMDAFAARLRALDPTQVLARGYAWLSDDAGHAVTSVAGLAVGASLHVELRDGSARVQVRQVQRRTTR